jgi:hypothetical protein
VRNRGELSWSGRGQIEHLERIWRVARSAAESLSGTSGGVCPNCPTRTSDATHQGGQVSELSDAAPRLEGLTGQGLSSLVHILGTRELMRMRSVGIE